MPFEALHRKNQTDIFGFTGDANTWITLKLTMRAYLLLREEYPLSHPFLTREENHFIFHGPVASFDGVGRFVLGLIDELQVVGPENFITFLRDKINSSKVVGL